MTASRRPLAAWLAAEICSLGGTRLSMVAIPWLVLTTTGSAALTGTVALAEMLPYVIAKGLGGPLIDRLGSRRIAVGCDLASVVVIAMVPVLHLADLLSLPVLMIIVAVAGLLRGPSDAAKQALVPALARLAEVRLERVTEMAATVERLATTVGAAAAGGLVALLGPALALGVNAVTFAIAALTIGLGLRRLDAPPNRSAHTRSTYRHDLAAGWAGLRHDRLLVVILIMITSTNLLDQGWSAVFVPVWVLQRGLGAGTVGLVFAVMMGFAVAGALLATAFGPRLPRLATYTVAFTVCGLPRFVVLGVDGASLTAVLVVMAVTGFASGFVNPILAAVVFERIPPDLVGRVNSLISSISWSLIPFGGLLAGLLVTGAGLDPTVVGFGLAYLLLTLLPVAVPTFRELGHRRTDTTPGHTPQPAEAELTGHHRKT